MSSLQEALESTLREIAEDRDLDVDHFIDSIPEIIPELVDDIATSMLSGIKKEAFPSGIARHRAGRLEFEHKLMHFWKEPLDLLDVFITCATEAGSEFNSEFRNEAVSEGDAVFEALTRLHGKACQVSKETLVLLRSGYADGAHGRWRALHELAVVACLISEHGQELAKRYLLHGSVQRYKAALQYQKYCERLGQEPLPEDEISALREERNELVKHFGSAFKEDYGWAARVTHPRNPSMAVLEESAGLDHWRPYYRLASHNVHPNSHGTYFRIGLVSHQEDVILAGPTTAGLADPGNSTAISLHLITSILLATRPTMDYTVYSYVLQKLSQEIADSFLEAYLIVEKQSDDGIRE